MKYALRAENLKKQYKVSRSNIVKALCGVDISIKEGELVAIMGRSGSGKSTLLNLLGTLDKPSSGKVFIGDDEITALPKRKMPLIRNEKIGFIFQSFNLIPTLTAKENVMLPLKYAGISKRDSSKKAIESLKILDMGDRLNHIPSQLSGGQQQRVAIARALSGHPDIILADEPTGELDSATSKSILEVITDLNERKGLTFLIVTHDNEVAKICNRIINLKDGLVVD